MKKIILFVFLLILIGEIILRIKGVPYRGYPPYYFKNTSYGFDNSLNYPPTDHLIYYDKYTYKIWTNSIGCFDYKISDNYNPDILLVGDSFTWGYTKFKDKFGTVLEKEVHLTVAKCGVSGYGTKLSYLKAKDFLKKFPKTNLIIYHYFLNDLDDDYLYPKFKIIGGFKVLTHILENPNTGKVKVLSSKKFFTIQKIKYWLLRNSYIYRFFKPYLRELIKKIFFKKKKELVDILHQKPNPYLYFYNKKWINDFIKIHYKNILKFLTLNKKLVVGIIPIKEQVYTNLLNCPNSDPARKLLSKVWRKNKSKLFYPQKMLKKFLQKHKIAYIDYLPLFNFYANHSQRCVLKKKKDLYWNHNSHWNERGNILAGLLLTKFLVDCKLINNIDYKALEKRVNNDLIKIFKKIPTNKIWNKAIYCPNR